MEHESEDETILAAATSSAPKNALLEQLRLAKEFRSSLEQSVEIAENEQSGERRNLAKKLLKERTDDILQLAALTEAVRGGYILHSYDQYLEKEDDNTSEEFRRAQKTLHDHCSRMDREAGAIKLAFSRRTEQKLKRSIPATESHSKSTHLSKPMPPPPPPLTVAEVAPRPHQSPSIPAPPPVTHALDAATAVPAVQCIQAPSIPVAQNPSSEPALAAAPIHTPQYGHPLLPVLLVQPENRAAQALTLAAPNAHLAQVSAPDDARDNKKRALDESSGDSETPLNRLYRSYAAEIERIPAEYPNAGMVDLTQDPENDD